MANLVTSVDIANDTFVDFTSRYIKSDVIYYGEDNKLTFKTYKKGPSPFTSTDKFFLIDKGREFRPDLVSRSAYGTTTFWWLIMEANGMKDILEFRAGVNIRIPNSIF